jgi:hypothetical protein
MRILPKINAAFPCCDTENISIRKSDEALLQEDEWLSRNFMAAYYRKNG